MKQAPKVRVEVIKMDFQFYLILNKSNTVLICLSNVFEKMPLQFSFGYKILELMENGLSKNNWGGFFFDLQSL